MLEGILGFLPEWLIYLIVFVLIISGAIFLLIFVWGTLAATEKLWRVVRYGEPLSWTDPLYWLAELPGKTKRGLRIYHAFRVLNSYFDRRAWIDWDDDYFFLYWRHKDKWHNYAKRVLRKEDLL